jgi:hypothetical protein
MHFDLVVPMWFAWLFYVVFGLVALCYLLAGLLALANYMGLHGPYCTESGCVKRHWPESVHRRELARKMIRDAYQKWKDSEANPFGENGVK